MDMIHDGSDPGAADPPAQDLRQRIRRFLAAQGEECVVSAYLFGSVAEGRSHRESDVDVGVVLQRRHFPDRLARSQERVRLLSGLIQATGRNEIDLVVLNDAPPRFRRAVVLKGERLLCLDAGGDLVFRRDAQLLAADLDVFMRLMEPLKLEALRK
jgi:predicted nucleotidyltransferase